MTDMEEETTAKLAKYARDSFARAGAIVSVYVALVSGKLQPSDCTVDFDLEYKDAWDTSVFRGSLDMRSDERYRRRRLVGLSEPRITSAHFLRACTASSASIMLEIEKTGHSTRSRMGTRGRNLLNALVEERGIAPICIDSHNLSCSDVTNVMYLLRARWHTLRTVSGAEEIMDAIERSVPAFVVQCGSIERFDVPAYREPCACTGCTTGTKEPRFVASQRMIDSLSVQFWGMRTDACVYKHLSGIGMSMFKLSRDTVHAIPTPDSIRTWLRVTGPVMCPDDVPVTVKDRLLLSIVRESDLYAYGMLQAFDNHGAKDVLAQLIGKQVNADVNEASIVDFREEFAQSGDVRSRLELAIVALLVVDVFMTNTRGRRFESRYVVYSRDAADDVIAVLESPYPSIVRVAGTWFVAMPGVARECMCVLSALSTWVELCMDEACDSGARADAAAFSKAVGECIA